MPPKNISRTGKRDSAPTRRAVIRLFMRAFGIAMQQYAISLQNLVPVDQPLPCNDESLTSVSISVAVVSGNNPSGVVIQAGIAGPFARSDNGSFVPLTSAKTFSRNGKVKLNFSMPHVTKQEKSVLSDPSNRIVLNLTALPKQIDLACLVVTCNTRFKVPILEYHSKNIGTPVDFQNQVTASGTNPAAVDHAPNSIQEDVGPLSKYFTITSTQGTTVHYGAVDDPHSKYTVSLQTGYGTAGTLNLHAGDAQGQYSSAGYSGTLKRS